MVGTETNSFVKIDNDIISCVHREPNVTRITKGYLIKIQKKFMYTNSLYKHIIKKLADYGGNSTKTYILCVKLDALNKINDNLNNPEYIKKHSVEERCIVLRTGLTILCHADNSYIIAVDEKNKTLLNRGATMGLYTKMTQPTFDNGVSLYKLNNISMKPETPKLVVIVVGFIIGICILLAVFFNNGNKTQLKNITNTGIIQIQQTTDNPVDISIDIPKI